MKIKLTRCFLALIAFTFVLTGCSNNEDVATIKNTESGILTFASVQDFQSTVQKVSSMTSEERLAWEKSKGFKSFGTICDEVYKGIDPTKFKTTQQIKDTVVALSDFLEMDKNKDGDYYVDAKECSNPARFIMNKNKMYIIKDSVFKQFDNGLASASISNIEKLKQEKNINSIIGDNSVKVRSKVANSSSAVTANISSFEQWGINNVYEGWLAGTQRYAVRVRLSTYIIAGPFRQHEYDFNNYKWTLGIYWGDYLSHTSSNIKTITSDDLEHLGKTVTYVNSDNYNAAFSVYESSLPSAAPPYYTEYHVYVSNGKGCVVSADYVR